MKEAKVQPFQVVKILFNKYGIPLAKAAELCDEYRPMILECGEQTDLTAEEIAEMIIVDEELETINALADQSSDEQVPMEDDLTEVPQQEDTEDADDFSDTDDSEDEAIETGNDEEE